MNQSITDSLSNNIDDIYINNEYDNKYSCGDDFLFKELVDDIYNSDNNLRGDNTNFDLDYVNIEMSISATDDYTVVEYKQGNDFNCNKFQIIENYYGNSSNTNRIDLPQKIIINDDIVCDKIQSDNIIKTDSINVMDESNKNNISEIDNIIMNDMSAKVDNTDEIIIESLSKEITNSAIQNMNSSNFFECFNRDVSINNSITCNKFPCANNKLNELTTSYMFEVEDLKKPYDLSFDDDTCNYEKIRKQKNFMGRISGIVVSAMMLFGGTNINELFN